MLTLSPFPYPWWRKWLPGCDHEEVISNPHPKRSYGSCNSLLSPWECTIKAISGMALSRRGKRHVNKKTNLVRKERVLEGSILFERMSFTGTELRCQQLHAVFFHLLHTIIKLHWWHCIREKGKVAISCQFMSCYCRVHKYHASAPLPVVLQNGPCYTQTRPCLHLWLYQGYEQRPPII